MSLATTSGRADDPTMCAPRFARQPMGEPGTSSIGRCARSTADMFGKVAGTPKKWTRTVDLKIASRVDCGSPNHTVVGTTTDEKPVYQIGSVERAAELRTTALAPR